MKIDETIRNLRKQRGLNQDELAADVEVSVDTVRRWEKGSQVPRVDELVRLASSLRVTVDELINGPSNQRTRIVMSYDWNKFEKGEWDMTGRLVEVCAKEDGVIGLRGSTLPRTIEELEQFKAQSLSDIDDMFAFQLKRGAIQTQPAV